MLQGLLSGLQGVFGSGQMPTGAMMAPMGIANASQAPGGMMGSLQGLLGGGQLPNMQGMMPQQGINLAGMGRSMMGLPPAAQPGFDPSVVSGDILGAINDPSVTPEKFIELLGMMQMASANTQQPQPQAAPQATPPPVTPRPVQVVNPYGQHPGVRLPGPLGGF